MWAAIKAAAQTGLEIISKVPMSGIIKAAVFVGIVGFTFWVMVRRTKKMHEDATEKRYTSPVDEILGKSYATDTDAYDDMDPAAKKLCKKLNKGWKSKKRRKKDAAKKKAQKKPEPVTVSLFPNDDYDEEVDPPKSDRPHFYRSSEEVLWEESKKKKRKPNPEKVKKAKANARKNRSKIDSKHMQDLKDLCMEWKESGCASTAEFKKRLDKIAEELGLPVDSIDDAIDDSLREQCPALF